MKLTSTKQILPLCIMLAIVSACSAPRKIALSPIIQSKSESPGFYLKYDHYALPSARPEYNSIVVTELTEECTTSSAACPVVWKVALDARRSPRQFFYGQDFDSGTVETPASVLSPDKRYRLEVANNTVTGLLDHGAARFSISSSQETDAAD